MTVMMTPMISISSSNHQHHHHLIYSSSGNRAYAYEGDDIARFTSILSELEVLDSTWDSVVLNKGNNLLTYLYHVLFIASITFLI